MSLTPAAVSRNVPMLERNLGVRLFHRSTRKLTLTEAGERFLHVIRGNLEELQASIASVATDRYIAELRCDALRFVSWCAGGVSHRFPMQSQKKPSVRRFAALETRGGEWTLSGIGACGATSAGWRCSRGIPHFASLMRATRSAAFALHLLLQLPHGRDLA